MNIKELLLIAIKEQASDLHLTVDSAPILRIDGSLVAMNLAPLSKEDTCLLVEQLLENKEEIRQKVKQKGEVDFAYEIKGQGRFRVNIFRQKNSWAVALRILNIKIPSMEDLGLPKQALEALCHHMRGLILVTGPTGSGKSTTLAAMLDYINRTRCEHILTLEDPIEYWHSHKNCIINQREVGMDTSSYAQALRAALREDPDVILVGEMRDLETIAITITAAETGHLVLSTLHTVGAAETIDRIIDAFPAHQQLQIRGQLANVLKGVISQQLIPRRDKRGRVALLELMIGSTAIANLIREGKTHQIYSQIQTGGSLGMMTMEASIMNHYQKGILSLEIAQHCAPKKDELKRLLYK